MAIHPCWISIRNFINFQETFSRAGSRKIFSAHNDQSNMNTGENGFQENYWNFWLNKLLKFLTRGKNWFSEKLRKNFVLENFWSESFSIRTSCIESSRFRARVAKGRPAFRDRITRRNPRVQNRISKGRSGLRKSKKYFRLIMTRVTWIVEKSGFQKNFENILS